jgi:hypothetical protein
MGAYYSRIIAVLWLSDKPKFNPRVHFNILASGFLGGRAEAHPYKRRRAYSV